MAIAHCHVMIGRCRPELGAEHSADDEMKLDEYRRIKHQQTMKQKSLKRVINADGDGHKNRRWFQWIAHNGLVQCSRLFASVAIGQMSRLEVYKNKDQTPIRVYDIYESFRLKAFAYFIFYYFMKHSCMSHSGIDRKCGESFTCGLHKKHKN